MRYLGIDYGSKKTGLALSDEAGTMGFPHEIVFTQDVRSVVESLVKEKQVGAVVIGESKDFSGEENPIMKEARILGDWIMETCSIPVYYEPEMMTSVEARRARDESVTGRSPKNTENVDDAAAALILTSFLSHHDRT